MLPTRESVQHVCKHTYRHFHEHNACQAHRRFLKHEIDITFKCKGTCIYDHNGYDLVRIYFTPLWACGSKHMATSQWTINLKAIHHDLTKISCDLDIDKLSKSSPICFIIEKIVHFATTQHTGEKSQIASIFIYKHFKAWRS